jgi:5'-3' exonuclease
MGIKSLNKLLRNRCPEVFRPIHLSDYAFKKVAIDLSLYLCKFKIACGDRWLTAFLNMIACLRKNQVHCVFIYDSGCPDEKLGERKERADAREKTEYRAFQLENSLSDYLATGEVSSILAEFCEKNQTQSFLTKTNSRVRVDVATVEHKISTLRGSILDITSADFDLTKELFSILSVPWMNAPLEAETMCADLCKRGLVHAALSEDTDVLAYASPIFLSKLEVSSGTCVSIDYSEMLDRLELSSDSFLDLCIMCGTDYNKNIRGVGPEGAYKFLKKHESIEGVGLNTAHDTTVLKYERGRQLFRDYEISDVSIPFCGTPDYKKLKAFAFQHNMRIDVDSLCSSFTKRCVVFEEEKEEG